jgi:transposase
MSGMVQQPFHRVARAERSFNRTKNSRRLTTRYNKLINIFSTFVLLTPIQISIRLVDTT